MILNSAIKRRLMMGIAILSFAPILSTPVYGLDNGLAQTPPMGWNSWNRFWCDINENLIRETADAMVSSGMQDAGYEFVNIDDCWQISRDAQDVIIPDPTTFPNGIDNLADYVHSIGLKLGVYSDRGTETCAGRPGSYGYEVIDADTYASWGVDYLKYDNCSPAPGSNQQTDYENMRDALAACGRPIVFSICAWDFHDWSPQTGNLWRTTGDIWDGWDRMLELLDINNETAFSAGPGRWNDPDMLEVGNGGMTDTENRSHFTLWCIAAAPLITGNDLRTMSTTTRDILTAPEVIAVDQDPAGIQGIRLTSTPGVNGNLEVWCKPIENTFTTKAVALFNRSDQAADITVTWSTIGLQDGPAVVRDLWARTELGFFMNSFTSNVPSHGVKLVKITGTSPTTAYVSDQHFHSADNGWGAVERDRSNGEQGSFDGGTITLDGITYNKGIGVHAPSRFICHLDGKASRFQSDIGIDDEVGGQGSVIFRVWDDSTLLYDSGIMTGTSPTQSIDLDVTGKSSITLEVTDAGDLNSYDHADWADARFSIEASQTNEAILSVVQPVYSLVDAGDDVELSSPGINIETYQWYKIGDPDMALSGSDPNYSGVNTDTLTIHNVRHVPGDDDEGYYYCIGSNSLPSASSNRDTGPGRVMTKRLVNYYPFDSSSIVGDNTISPDTVGDFDAVLMEEGSAGLPMINTVDQIVGTGCLDLDNADWQTDSNGQFAQLAAGIADWQDMSVGAWFYQKSPQPWSRLWSFGTGQNAKYMTLQSSALRAGGPLRFAISMDGSANEQTLGSLVPDPDTGAWHHVAITLAGDTARLYLDGELIETNDSITNNPIDIGATLNYLGKSQWAADPELDGMLDDLKIWNYAISGYDVAQEYLEVHQDEAICDWENYDLGSMDVNGNCIIDLPDFAAWVMRWLEDDNFYYEAP